MRKNIETAWRVERRVPLAFVVTLLMQGALVIMWAAQLDARVTSLEVADPDNRQLSAQLARLEERIDAVRSDVGDIRLRLEKFTQR